MNSTQGQGPEVNIQDKIKNGFATNKSIAKSGLGWSAKVLDGMKKMVVGKDKHNSAGPETLSKFSVIGGKRRRKSRRKKRTKRRRKSRRKKRRTKRRRKSRRKRRR